MTLLAEQIEKDVRDTLAEGTDIYQKVQSITLNALTKHDLDLDNIQRVVEAVLTGMREGLGNQYQPAKDAFRQSVTAIDDALVKTAQASKLAIEEAASRLGEFSQHDLDQATEQIKSLENIFLETLENVTRGSETLFDVGGDFIKHARQNGTAVGEQVGIALESMNKFRREGQQAFLSEVSATTSIMAKIGSGILAGIAESLEHKN
jgi:hypothetical protein